ncbi:MAG: DUF1819 family protein [Chloroflexota bacterium]|nr:DUF1819 family protein [Chloroflexota bacterium]
MTNDKRYKLSFTSTALGLTESINIAEVYLGCHDWELTKDIINKENTLQSRTLARNKRVAREIIFRLSLMTNDQLDLLVDGSLEEQRLLLWFAICNYYRIIREFAIEVLHEKFLAMDMHLNEDDYHAFIIRKADWHPELDEITDSTKNKIRTVIFRMLREAGLLSEDFEIIRVIPSTLLSQALQPSADFAYRIYPAFLSEFEF